MRHCGVFSEAQCVHLRAPVGDDAGDEDEDLSPLITDEDDELSFFTLLLLLLLVFDFPIIGMSDSGNEVQILFVDDALDRLLRARPWNNASGLAATVPASSFSGKSENESSTKFESHSSSATSSLYKPNRKKKQPNHTKFPQKREKKKRG